MLIDCDNKEYKKELVKVCNRDFHRMMKRVACDFINYGIAWIHPYYTTSGELQFKRFKPYEILPFWKDEDHRELEFALRVYKHEVIRENTVQRVEFVDLYTESGIDRYEYQRERGYFYTTTIPYVLDTLTEQPYNWGRIPLVAFRSNADETPLINNCKSIQDAINTIQSVFADNLLENQDTSVLVLVGYPGEKEPGELRQNLSTFRMIAVDSAESAKGDVKTLQMEVKGDNYKLILSMLRKSFIEATRMYDVKDERVSGGSVNEMNIRSMYIDMDLDANDIETEFHASFQELLTFIDIHLERLGHEPFEREDVVVQLSRDTIVNMESVIRYMVTSFGTYSLRTYLKNLPIVADVDEEINQMKEEGIYDAIMMRIQGENPTGNNRIEKDVNKENRVTKEEAVNKK